MAAPPGPQIAHDHQLGPIRPPGGGLAGGEGGQGVGGAGVETLGPAGLAGLAGAADGGAGGAAGPHGSQLHPPHQPQPGLGRQGTAETDHAQPVTPVAKEPGLLLLAVQIVHVGVGLAVLAGPVPQPGQIRPPRHRQQRLLRPRCLCLGLDNLPRLGHR